MTGPLLAAELLQPVPVSRPGQWRYALYDLLTRRQIAEHMPFTVEPFDRSLTEAGTLTASLQTGDPGVQSLDPWGRAVQRRTSLVVLRDDVVVGEYVVWNRPSYKASEKKMTLSCSEIRSVLDKHRIFRPTDGYGSRKTLEFVQADAFDVFRALLADAQAATYQGLPVGDLAIEMDPTVLSGVLIDRRDVQDQATAYHGYSMEYYGPLLDDLADTAGFEWRIDTFIDSDNQLRRRLVLGYPHVGRGPDADSLTLEYPGTIADYQVDDDGESSANYVASIGAGEEEAAIWGEAYNAAELAAGYPLLETTASYKDDTSPVIAAGHAAAELSRVSGDVQLWSLDLIGYPAVAPGDYVRIRICDEARWRGSSAAPVEKWVRVVGMKIQPAPKERTTLTIEDPRGTS
ncbi:hypothetical protein NE235_10740 [Actinoallomurus spadix]|uniref:Minor tail protein n=1 Tax=Actinoallomurus spadix TaxID=79912 RepID=A0ABN0WVN4_9ACTN|nr:hypothetical protein [Actinoallomurus spadix]MCO5986579.1 hypothetical protein [Actinoallomurus spadix]